MPLQITTAQTDADLNGILALQRANLAAALTPDVIREQGFVTVVHTLDILRKLNDIQPHIIARDNDQVVAYLLAMTVDSRFELPVLVPMFEVFDQITYQNRRIAEYQYIVVGQVCVDKAFRGQGLLAACYDRYEQYFSPKFDFAITEIAATNTRSLHAHARVGFVEIHRYTDQQGIEWAIVIRDWRQLS